MYLYVEKRAQTGEKEKQGETGLPGRLKSKQR